MLPVPGIRTRFFYSLPRLFQSGKQHAQQYQVSIYYTTNVFACQTVLDKLIAYYLEFKGAERITALPSFLLHSTTVTSSLPRVSTD